MPEAWQTAAVWESDTPIGPSGGASRARARWSTLETPGDPNPPYSYADARACGIAHAREQEEGQQFWTGSCATITPYRLRQVSNGPGGSLAGLKVVTSPPSGTLGSTPTMSHQVWATGGLGGGRPYAAFPYYVPTEIRFAVPGYVTALAEASAGTRMSPEWEILSVDAAVRAEIRADQTYDTAPTLGYYARTDTANALPKAVSDLGANIAVCATTPGTVGPTMTWTGLAPGEYHALDFQTTEVVAGTDIGYVPPTTTDQVVSQVVEFDVVWDYQWHFRWRPGNLITVPTDPPLRWFQRNDGLGISAVPRFQQVSSQQASIRHTSAYR